MWHIYLITFLLGCVAASAELLSRYDRITQIFKYLASWVYLFINGSSAILAYWFISEYKLDLGTLTQTEIGKILVSGTSSMIILRSSFASIRNGSQNIEAGFVSITNVFLKSADRTFDRKRSIEDYKEIETVMKDIDFNKAKIDLPLICLSMMKNVPYEEQKLLGDDIAKLSQNENCSLKAKSISLGTLVSEITGIELLKEVVFSNKDIFSNTDNREQNQTKIDVILNKLKLYGYEKF